MKMISPICRNILYFAILIFLVSVTLPFQPSFAQTTIKIAAFGDSLSAGFGLDPNDSFPEQLQTALHDRGYTHVEVVNAGNSGDTTADGLSRLDWSIQDDIDGVILEFGANDSLRGLSIDEAFNNLNDMIARFEERNIAVLLTGMEAPPNMGQDYQDQFRNIYATLADKYSVGFYPFFLKDVAANANLNQDDGIHPNKDGVNVIVKNILPDVLDLILKINQE